MGSLTVGDKSITLASVGDDTVNVIYFGQKIIYIYQGQYLLDSEENELLDSDGNRLMCI